MQHTLPYTSIPLLILIEMVYTATLWLNAFPPKNGVSMMLSPRAIMTGHSIDFKKHCQLPFSTYAQTHEENNPTNSQAARTVGAINLGPNRNLQGTHKFLNLCTGKKITCQCWTELPMPKEVIDRVNQLDCSDGQVELLTFFNWKGNLIGDLPQPPDKIAGVDKNIESQPTEINGTLPQTTALKTTEDVRYCGPPTNLPV